MLDDLRIGWWVIAATIGGCGVEQIPDPLLAEVCLAAVEDRCVSESPAGVSTDVVLLGYHFRSIFEVDLEKNDPPSPLGRFYAWIGGKALEHVELANQTLRGLQVIRATLPETLPEGTLSGELETPTGQRSTLEKAFVVSAR